MNILGLTGYAGSGKTTVARHLVQHHGFTPISLADPFKIFGVVEHDFPREEVFGPRPKSEATRRFLQQAGTEWGRDRFGDDWWIRHADVLLYRLHRGGVKNVVIDDVRFLNEAEWIDRIGGALWGITGRKAPMAEAAAGHRSETEITAALQRANRLFLNDTDNAPTFWAYVNIALAHDFPTEAPDVQE